MVHINEKAVNVPQLQETARRLKKRNKRDSEYSIFKKLLNARVKYLDSVGLLMVFG
jgi:hypothetical protein